MDINRECTHMEECAMTKGTFEALCTNPELFLQNKTGFDDIKGSLDGATITITCANPNSTDTILWMIIAERKDDAIKGTDHTNAEGYLITEPGRLLGFTGSTESPAPPMPLPTIIEENPSDL